MEAIDTQDTVATSDFTNYLSLDVALEKYIKENLEKINDYVPSEKVLSQIKIKLEEEAMEQFIKNNQNEMDDLLPSASLWDKIDSELDQDVENKVLSVANEGKQVKMVSINTVWRVAAAVALLLTSIFSYIYFATIPSRQDSLVQQVDTAQEADNFGEFTSPELAEAEQYYTSLIHQRMTEIKSYDLAAMGIKEDFKEDILQLDIMYENMKNDLLESRNNEIVISEMIKNLQIRIELLNRQLQILESIKRSKDENRETVNS